MRPRGATATDPNDTDDEAPRRATPERTAPPVDALAGTLPSGTRTVDGWDGEASTPASTEPPLPPRYKDLGRIASGGCGDVRRVLDTQFDRVVAMKTLRWELVGSLSMRARFLVEAEVTAQLEHPGIVAVHERGELPDGRLWFTMKEVRGRTLRDVILEVHASAEPSGFRVAPSGWTFRRLADAFVRIVQAVAFAHRHGIVHRDLKPENLMVGDLGEVLVMDWGLARRVGTPGREPDSGAGSTPPAGEDTDSAASRLTQHGEVLGTPAYMPPEQARGQHDRHGPESDVYSLGAILHCLLTSRPPYEGVSVLGVLRQVLAGPPRPIVEVMQNGPPVPAELVAICQRAMVRDIEARYPDASAMADELVSWLDGARRREQALSLVERVRGLEPVIADLRARRSDLEAEARRVLEGIKPFEPVELKAPAWALQDEAASLGREAALKETEWLEGMHGALSIEPELPEAHAALAEHYKDRLLEAERASRAEDAIRFEARLRAHDRGPYTALLRGEGALTLVTDPPGASVALYRYVEEKRRLVPRFVEEIGPTPILKKRIQKGSYLCVIRAEGRAEVRYPVLIERGGHWDGVPPGEAESFAIPLPGEGEVEPNDVYVPAGWCWIGADPEAPDSLPSKRIWVDGFVIGRFPVTSADYLVFLDDLVDSGQEVEAAAACPRRELGAASSGEVLPVFRRGADGRFLLPPDWAPDLPVVLIDWHAATAYARWRGQKTGHPVRLPNELEWEKAARGADGRFLPWGNHMDAAFTCALESHRGPPGRMAVSDYASDESPFGVRGLAGNVRDWCINVWRLEGPTTHNRRLQIDPASPEDPDFRAIRGGTWGSALVNGRAAARFGGRPERWTLAVGIRVARSLRGA